MKVTVVFQGGIRDGETAILDVDDSEPTLPLIPGDHVSRGALGPSYWPTWEKDDEGRPIYRWFEGPGAPGWLVSGARREFPWPRLD